jgi:UDP-N-acetylmuramate dehydrogenase
MPSAAASSTTALSGLTTLRVGGPARRFQIARTTDELVDAVSRADADGTPVLLVGGGSNLLVADAGFDGLVVQVATRGITQLPVDYCGGAELQVAAG